MAVTEPTVIVVNEGTCPHCGSNSPAILAALTRIEQKVSAIMSEDASVLAVVTDENSAIQELSATETSLQALVQSLLAEQASGTALQPSTLAALQAAQAALDSLNTKAASDLASDTPAPAAPAS